jgi:hypothetical protein
MADDFDEIDFDETDAGFDYDAQEEFENQAEGQDAADIGAARSYNGPVSFMDAALTVGWLVGTNGSDDTDAGQVAAAFDYYDKIKSWSEGVRRPEDERTNTPQEREGRLDSARHRFGAQAKSAYDVAEQRMTEWKNTIVDYESAIQNRLRNTRSVSEERARAGERTRFDKKLGRRLTPLEEQAAKRAARRIIIKRVAKILLK